MSHNLVQTVATLGADSAAMTSQAVTLTMWRCDDQQASVSREAAYYNQTKRLLCVALLARLQVVKRAERQTESPSQYSSYQLGFTANVVS